MFYHIETEERTAGGRTATVYTLKHSISGASAQIWPAHGFNCLRWQIPTDNGSRDLLYAAAEWETNPVPTRSGIPILFPFPNRIRAGKYHFGGKDYQLPLNDSTKQNAIHGWASRHPWRIFGYNADDSGAWIHADFQLALNAPEATRLWPTDSILSLIYRFTERSLRLESRIRNLGESPVPIGLGYHPYLHFPCGDATIERCKLRAPARNLWECVDNLPTGKTTPVPDELNFNVARGLSQVQLDTLYTALGAIAERPDGLLLRAELGHTEHPGALQVWTSPDFRESVLFTPPHRQALCIEPYTCATDAINLTDRGIDAGWKVLPSGGEWTGAVEFRWEPGAEI